MSESPTKQSGVGTRVWVVIAVFVGLFAYALLAPSYYRDTRNPSPTLTCINNLRQIDAAESQWALDNGKTIGDVVAADQLTNYLYHQIMPKCPSGGTYVIGKVGEPPTCSLGTNVNPPHVLP